MGIFASSDMNDLMSGTRGRHATPQRHAQAIDSTIVQQDEREENAPALNSLRAINCGCNAQTWTSDGGHHLPTDAHARSLRITQVLVGRFELTRWTYRLMCDVDLSRQRHPQVNACLF